MSRYLSLVRHVAGKAGMSATLVARRRRGCARQKTHPPIGALSNSGWKRSFILTTVMDLLASIACTISSAVGNEAT